MRLRRAILRKFLTGSASGKFSQAKTISGSLSWDEADFLQKFNAIWPAIAKQVPFWRDVTADQNFTSYEQFAQLPLMSRDAMQAEPKQFWREGRSKTTMLATGGSTGQPLVFPVLPEELEIGRRNQISARAWYGISPGDRCFMIWGHATQLDARWRARLATQTRRFKDWVLCYHRVSAYRLTPAIIHRVFDDLLRFQTEWIYAYSSSLLSLVRGNGSSAQAARELRLRACICAAEPLNDEGKREVADFFQCPVGMEYGSVELRVCAHTRPDAPGYFVFTDDYLVEALPTATPRVFDVAVTKLFPAAMPLVRYVVGDQIELSEHSFTGGPVCWFENVLGRMNDNLRLADGSEIHSETVTHAVRAERDVLAFQLHQFAEGCELRLVIRQPEIPRNLQENIAQRLGRIHPELGRLRIVRVSDLETTSAGKRRWIVRHVT